MIVFKYYFCIVHRYNYHQVVNRLLLVKLVRLGLINFMHLSLSSLPLV